MATEEQRARRRAQRAVARNLAENRQRAKLRLPRERLIGENIRRPIRATYENYAYDVMAGIQPEPAPGTPQARILASLASKARHGQADPQFETQFSKYWYHHRQVSAPDAQRYEEGNEADDFFTQEGDEEE